jgi:hypothetical protein
MRSRDNFAELSQSFAHRALGQDAIKTSSFVMWPAKTMLTQILTFVVQAASFSLSANLRMRFMANPHTRPFAAETF